VGAVAVVVLSLAELCGRHTTAGAALGASIILRGRYAPYYWTGTVATGAAVALLGAVDLLADVSIWWLATAGALAQVSVLSYELCFVRAGQEVPLS
jgi:hypothetical protein